MAILIPAGYSVLVAALLGVCLLTTPGWAVVAWCAIGVLSAGAVIVGAASHRPLKRAPWWLLSGAILAMTTGDALFSLGTRYRNAGWLEIVANVCYLAMFPLIMASFTILTRTSVVLDDRSRLLDLLMFTSAAALAAWVFLIGPSLHAPRLSNADRSMLAAYVLGDLLVLITSVRLLFAARWSCSVILLAAGSGGLLAANLGYALAEVGTGWQPGGAAQVGYLALFLGWGASALHPSMVELTAPVDSRPHRLRRHQVTLLRLCLALPAVTILAEAMGGLVRDGVVIAMASIVMCELVILRLTDIIGKHRRSVARERALREACGTLVAAVDSDEVSEAVQGAVGRLVPGGVQHTVVISAEEIYPAPSAGRDGDAGRPASPDPVPPPASNPQRGTRLLPTRVLDPALRERLGRFDTVLVCPLAAAHYSPGAPAAGFLLVAADQRALATMRDAVEVLATQATLALERITLSDMINRRDGDLYLRTVIQNTADVVVVIDSDERIRYVSPSLMTVLGVDPSANATLRDIVHPDDHGQLAWTRDQAERTGDPKGARDCWSLRRPDGSRVVVEISYRDLRRDRMVRGFVITMRDITERRAREQEMIRVALQNSGGWRNRQSSLNKFR